MKSFLAVISAFILIGCAGTQPPETKYIFHPFEQYHLLKNDITGEFELVREKEDGSFYWYDVIASGDSIGCVKAIQEIEAERRAIKEQKERDAEIQAAWHEVKIDSIKVNR